MIAEIQIHPLGGPALSRAYVAGEEAAGRFFAHPHPRRLASFARQAGLVAPRFDRAAREAAAAALTPTSPRAAERLERFVAGGGYVVTTGQQAGLFTGPLYTIYKALTAARLARILEERLDELVLPVFWCASEDHDWDEIDHAFLLDGRYRLQRVQLAADSALALPAAERRLGAAVENTLDELRHLLQGQCLDPRVLESVERAYRPERMMGEAFRELLGDLLTPFDFLMTDAADAAVKRMSRGVLTGEAAAAEHHQDLLRQRGAELREAGYHEQVALTGGGSNLFLRTEVGREKLERVGELWQTRESRQRLTTGALRGIIDADPARVSPNALLRPVVESAVFPVLAYVGGPAEISYFAQSAALFQALEVPMPVVFPRASVTLVPSMAQRGMQALQLSADELREPFDALRARLVRRAAPAAAGAAADALRRAIVERFEEIAHAAAPDDPHARLALARHRNRALLEVDDARRSVHRAVRVRERARWRRLRRVKNAIAPLDVPQERTLNALTFLACEPALLERVSAALSDVVALDA